MAVKAQNPVVVTISKRKWGAFICNCKLLSSLIGCVGWLSGGAGAVRNDAFRQSLGEICEGIQCHAMALTSEHEVLNMKFWQNRLAKLFEDHRRQLVSIVTRRISDRETAVELVQDVYARLMKAGDRGTEEENTKILYASVRNAVIDYHRSNAGRANVMNGILPVQLWQNESSSPQDHAESRQALGALDQALLELTPKAREMFLLHRIEGISNAKLARKYGISVSAVEKQLARTMRHCQERLAAYRDPE